MAKPKEVSSPKRGSKPKKVKKDIVRVTGDFNVVAVDPSLKRPGFALLHYNSGTRTVELIKKSNVDNSQSKQKSHGSLLIDLYSEFVKYIPIAVAHTVAENYAFVRERGYSNFATQHLAKVCGVLDLTVALSSRTQWFYELPPASVKLMIGGSGKSTKEEVAANLPLYVGEQQYACDDESDAVAVGVAWLIKNEFIDKVIIPRKVTIIT